MKKDYKLFQTLSFIITISSLFFTSHVKSDTTYVSGVIANGNWTLAGSPYVVTGNILVAGLAIDPGVSVLFAGNYELQVQGKIEAIGSQQSQILFTTKTGVESWKGIRFQNSSLGSYLKWCIVEKANNSGIRILESLPEIRSCTFQNNQSPDNGGGLNISNTISGTMNVTDCIFKSNSINTIGTFAAGGGAYFNSGNVNLNNCYFLKNKITLQFSSNDWIYACGGGVATGSATVNMRNCIVKENKITATNPGGGGGGAALGGGVSIIGGTNNIKIVNSIIEYDTANASGAAVTRIEGGGLYFQGSGQAIIENSNILYNKNDAVRRNNSIAVQIINSIIYYNNNGGAQIVGAVTCTYSCVQGGYTGTGNTSLSPILDPCDKLVSGSPCIDAGNPNSIYNDACFPPSTGGLRNDMGAYGSPGACDWLYTQDTCSTWPELSIKIELTALMEGLYNPVTNMMVRPQVERMYLRKTTAPYAIVEPAAATIGQNGISTTEFIFNSPPTGTYYLVIKNWNNLETWSKTGGEFLYNDGETNYYDFTNASSQAFGNNQKLIGSRWCTYSGSVTPDSLIDLADILQINSAKNSFTTGYNINDLNGDNQVNLTDQLIVYNNSAAFIGVKNPYNP